MMRTDCDPVFYQLPDDFWRWCMRQPLEDAIRQVFYFPDAHAEIIQKKYYTRFGNDAIEHVSQFYILAKKYLRELDLALVDRDQHVLDFACGWGGVTRFLVKDIHCANIMAVDPEADAIQVCHQARLPVECIQIPKSAPLRLVVDGSLDVIFAYSISNRLSPEELEIWLGEWERMLKPGGVICLSLAANQKPVMSQEMTMTSLEQIRKIAGSFAYTQYTAANTLAEFDQDMVVLQKANGVVAPIAVTPESVDGGDAPSLELAWTGERLVPPMRGQIAMEHLHRYALAVECAEGKQVLDIACGEGYGSKLLAQKAAHVIGIDINEEVVKHAEAKYGNAQCQFKIGSGELIPLTDHSVDLAVSFETIEHVDNYRKFVSELKRCLKPNGMLIISSPDKIPFNQRNKETNPYHVHEMKHVEFVRLLEEEFRYCVIARQRMSGQVSIIAPDHQDGVIQFGVSQGGYTETSFLPGVSDGIFSIAVCSDVEMETLPMGVFEGIPEIQDDERKGYRVCAELDVLAMQTLLGLIKDFLPDSLVARVGRLEDELKENQTELVFLRREYHRLEEKKKQQLAALAHEQAALQLKHAEQIRQLELSQHQYTTLQLKHAEQTRQLEAEQKTSSQVTMQLNESRRQTTRMENMRSVAASQRQIMRQRVEKRQQDLIHAYNRAYSFRGVLEGIKKAIIRKVVKLNRSFTVLSGQAGFHPVAAVVATITGWVLKRWQLRKKNIIIIEDSNLFDQTYYAEQNKDIDFEKENPIIHFLREGAADGKNPNHYFNTHDYLKNNQDVAVLGINPLLHFITLGARQERDPGPGFNTLHYLEHNSDVAQSDMAPFLHYYFFGKNEKRSPVSGHGSGTPGDYQSSSKNEMPDNQRFTDDCLIEKDPEQFTKKRATGNWKEMNVDYPADVQLIAFYLPQYHPIPENDEWWGCGFTEWENVVKAKPLFPGHHQPHLPADLGFYDLRIPEVREKQADMARSFGIHGFCYYYYWFNGRRILERPLQEVLESGRPDFPFCICWANENWTRVWDGQEKHILLEQTHSLKSDIAFIHDVLPVLQDCRYIRFQGKPVLLVYRVDKLKNPVKTCQAWREVCAQAGIGEIHLCAVKFESFKDPRPWGFDAFVEFPPNSFYSPNIASQISGLDKKFTGRVADYRDMVHHSLQVPATEYGYHRGVMLQWDNSPRRRYQSILYQHATPENYEQWLAGHVQQSRSASRDESMVFINAWNEWGEGSHLEPDQKYGYAFLEATSRALLQPAQTGDAPDKPGPVDVEIKQKNTDEYLAQPDKSGLVLIVHDALYYGVQYHALALARTIYEQFPRPLFIVLKKGGGLEKEFNKWGTVFNLEKEQSMRGSEESALAAIWQQLESANVTQALACTVVAGDVSRYLKQRGLAVVTLVNELPTTIESNGYQQLLAQTIQASDKLVFPARNVRDACMRAFGLESQQCLIRPQGVLSPNPYLQQRLEAKQAICRRHGLDEHARIIVNCASGGIRKGPDLFLAVAKQILTGPEKEDIHFIWVGDLADEVRAWCEHDLEKMSAKKNIHFVGFQKDVAQYMAASELFLLTSREDPFPNVMLSAMEAGLPVLAFANSGGADELLTEDTGVLVSYLDTPAMAGAVLDLLNDAEKRRHIGKQAAQWVTRHHQFEDYTAYLLGLFEGIAL